MPEHAAVDTSKFNELIPQALQQTLYTKISNVQKGKKLHQCHFATHKYIYLGAAGKSTCNSWNGFHSLLNQFRKIDNQMTSGKHIHKATENPWESKNVTLLAYLQEVTSHPLNSVHMSCHCMSHRNKPLSASGYIVSFHTSCSSVSGCPLHNPCFNLILLVPKADISYSALHVQCLKTTTQQYYHFVEVCKITHCCRK